MLVLVTGAAGRIGTAFVAGVGGAGFDLSVRATDLVAGDGVAALDVTDPDACRVACRGVDAVLHLAADPDPHADFRTSVLPVNVVGTYNVVEAALAEGVGRIVAASSAQAVEGYPTDHQVRETDAPRPRNDYGAGKAFGEALGSVAGARGPTTFVSVRIGYYADDRPGPDASWRDRTAWLSPRDAVQLLGLALTAPLGDVPGGHVVVHGVSDNAGKRLSIDATRRLLGYTPVDDAFP